MDPRQMFVIHSYTADGRWRGIEKCKHQDDGALVLYETREEAQAVIDAEGMSKFLHPVEVVVVFPSVGT